MKMPAILSAFALVAALVSVSACAGESGDPSKGDHDATAGGVCGGCEIEGDVQYDANGFVTAYCGSCDDPVPLPSEIPTTPTETTPTQTGDIPPVLSLDGNKTKAQCEKEYNDGVAACNEEENNGVKKCDTDNAGVGRACLLRECGTTSPYHYCVKAKGKQCAQEQVDAIAACVGPVRDEGKRCRQSVWIDWTACYRDASNRVSAIMRWINPFK